MSSGWVCVPRQLHKRIGNSTHGMLSMLFLMLYAFLTSLQPPTCDPGTPAGMKAREISISLSGWHIIKRSLPFAKGRELLALVAYLFDSLSGLASHWHQVPIPPIMLDLVLADPPSAVDLPPSSTGIIALRLT